MQDLDQPQDQHGIQSQALECSPQLSLCRHSHTSPALVTLGHGHAPAPLPNPTTHSHQPKDRDSPLTSSMCALSHLKVTALVRNPNSSPPAPTWTLSFNCSI